MENNPESRWVAARLAAVTPPWCPNVARARALLHTRTRAARRTGWYRPLLAAGAVAIIVTILAPPIRTLAHELWYRLLITRVEVVRVDLSRIPLETTIRTNGLPQAARDGREAAEMAGFAPLLPSPDVLPDVPSLSVIGPTEVAQTIRTSRLESALRLVGATDLEVPSEWDGVTLRGFIGPVVVAHYPNGVEVVQTTPIRLDLPEGFRLAQFAEVAFRTTGLTWWEARNLGNEFAARPAWLLDVPDNEPTFVETLPGGNGVLIDEMARDGQSRVTVVVSRTARIYTVSSPNRLMSLRVAAALP